MLQPHFARGKQSHFRHGKQSIDDGEQEDDNELNRDRGHIFKSSLSLWIGRVLRPKYAAFLLI